MTFVTIWGRILRDWWGAGTDCLERLWMPCPWRCVRPGEMEHWAVWSSTWSSGWQVCLWQGAGAWWSLGSLPTQAILWLKESVEFEIHVVALGKKTLGLFSGQTQHFCTIFWSYLLHSISFLNYSTILILWVVSVYCQPTEYDFFRVTLTNSIMKSAEHWKRSIAGKSTSTISWSIWFKNTVQHKPCWVR